MVGPGLQRCLYPAGGCGLAARVGGRPWHGDQLTHRGTECFATFPSTFPGIFTLMDILYLLIPLSVILVFFILGGLWWAIYRGQFEDVEAEGERILKES